ncbi:MAG: alpha-(1-2)-phosphatidylinositol mannosyltransferase [Acidobacteria bacterium]|nr:MAG: alpha-(1-2)-phosphatidylinositol mannosyltransferase [Acidobacteriota bacterium]
MKMLLVTNDFPPRAGGIEQYMLTLLNGLAPSEVIVVAPECEGAREFDTAAEFEVIRLSATRGRIWPSPSLARYLARLAATRDVDFVAFASMLPLATLGPAISRYSQLPFVIWHHGAELAGVGRLPGLRQSMAALARRSSLQFVVSEWTLGEARRLLGDSSPLRLLRAGVDLTKFNPRVDGSAIRRRYGIEDSLVVVCVGRLVPRKGQDTLIRVMPTLLKRHPDARLLIVGTGPSAKRLERLAELHGVMREVHFTGVVESDYLPAHYAAGDIYASPIRTRKLGLEAEGLGVVFLEAAAMGLPIVAGRSGGTSEAIKDGLTGILVDGTDDSEVVATLDRLLGDGELRHQMGDAGRRWMEEDFDKAGMAARFREAIAEVMQIR